MNKRDTVKEVFSLAIFIIKVIHTTMAGCSFETRFKGTVYPKINLHVVVDSLLLVELPSLCKGTEGHLCHSAWPIKIIHLKSNVSFQTS